MPNWRWRATSTPWQARADQLLCPPEIVTRGFVYVKESEELLQELRELGMTEGEWIALWRGGNENA